MYYLLLYKTAEDYMERRPKYRDEHLAYARDAHSRGELLLGGAFTDPPDTAVLLFKADSPAIAEDFARNDVYVKNGIVTSWHVRHWNVVVGGDEPSTKS